MTPPSLVALIPARSGSKRIPHKNVKPLAGHPLMAYSIAAALESRVFSAVIVSTDSADYARVAEHYGAEVPFLRASGIAGETSPDIEWIDDLLTRLRDSGRSFDGFSILRPTSPFRRADTIRRAFDEFVREPGVDSLRAVEKCHTHPGKMWVLRGRRLLPLLPFGSAQAPWHSTPYAALPEVYEQNASLELAWTRVVLDDHSIAGSVIVPFVTEGAEGLDLNEPRDWTLAEELLRAGAATLPPVTRPPFELDRLDASPG